MLPKRWLRSTINGSVLILFFIMLFTVSAYAATNDPPLTVTPAKSALANISAETMLVNFAKSVPNLMRLITAIAYVLGMTFIIRGIVRLKHVGESRTMMSQEHNLSGPIIFIIIGSCLLYFPTVVQVGMSTFWTEPNPYGYLKFKDQWSQFLNVVFSVIQFIGALSFIRGLVVLSRMGGHGGQPGTLSKGMTHIIGGILCINIYQFVQVIIVTLGLKT